MLRALFALKTLAWGLAVLPFFISQVAEAEIGKDIETILAEEGLTGMAWALIDASGEASIGAVGLQDKRSGSTFSPDRRFHVGSLSKSVLATGVLRLATAGRIDLDTPVLRYLPELSFENPWAGSSDVTVRHLLDHTSGLNDAHMWHMFSERADPDAPLIAAFPDPKLQLRIRAQPGSRFSYSTMGYTLLGMIIESVVGERYETYLDEHVLDALAMRESTFAFTTQQGEDADPALAWGHVDGGLRHAASPIFLRPAGQFTTTASDLVRFAEFLLGDGVVDGQTFIEEALMRSRGKPSGTEAAEQGLIAGYALGMGRRDRHGAVGFCHGGNIVGFVAMLCIFPGEDKAFAYSVNMDNETANYGRLEGLFIEALNIAESPAPQTADSASDISEWYGRYVLSPNRFQMFEYVDTIFGAIEISAEGGALTMASLQRETRRLRPVGDRLFSANDRSTTSHVLYRGNHGEYLISDGFQTFEKVPAAYLLAQWTSIFLGLAGLVWVLIAGSISLIRYRFRMFRRPEAPAFVASLSLLTPIPFFATQPFMALGDFTLASALLAIVTLLLPIGMLLTISHARKTWKESRTNLLNGLAAAFVLQWCAVLFVNGMLPFRLWA
jgi:CubicO group peptidase (beta-lactamase class C family)